MGCLDSKYSKQSAVAVAQERRRTSRQESRLDSYGASSH